MATWGRKWKCVTGNTCTYGNKTLQGIGTHINQKRKEIPYPQKEMRNAHIA